jgi:GxxExxY protein
VDFLLEYPNKNIKIIVELKVAEEFHKRFFDQLMVYLKNNKVELGLLAIFTKQKVLVKRVINQKIP